MASLSTSRTFRRRFLRFPLWALFCVVTIAAIATSWGTAVYRRRAAEREIYVHNGRVYFDWQMDENGRFTGVFREYKGWHRLSRRLSLYGFRYIRAGSTFDDRALAQLRAFPEVEYLDVGYTLITDQGLETLGRSGHMRHLKSLELSHTKVTDRGLVHLTGFPALTRLYLDGTAITDAGVAILGQLENLRSLDVEDTSITASGIQAIRRANPTVNMSPYRGGGIQ